MQNLVPSTRPAIDFEPVPRKYRYDGWTAERQRAFIAALAETGSVKAAAKRINMSPEGAYYLRRQPGADSFRAAWHAALDHGVQCLTDIAIDRAIEGVPVPIHWRGEQVGEKRWYNDRLLMFILRHHLADRYGGPGLAHGTRSRETIEREAAENCPVCKARAVVDAETDPDADELRARSHFLDALLKRYSAKVRYERHARLRGYVVAADFTVRQLTAIEFSAAAVGGSDAIGTFWRDAADRLCDRSAFAEEQEDEAVAAIALCRALDDARRAVWNEDGMLRPITDPLDGMASTAVPNGEDKDARIAAQHRARVQMAAAQELWEAAASEEGWARFSRLSEA